MTLVRYSQKDNQPRLNVRETMNTLKTYTCRSIPDLFDRVFKIWGTWTDSGRLPEEIWYRGVTDGKKYNLIPGAYRKTNIDEGSIMAKFESMAPSFVPRQPLTEWDWYFLAQHYGLPTRLLDWTESPLVALYFALEGWKGRSTPAIWVLDAARLNKVSTKEECTRSVKLPYASHWLTSEVTKGIVNFKSDDNDVTNNGPLAILPNRAEPRIVAQQGMFTVHGVSRDPIDKVMLSSPEGSEKICRIDLKGIDRDTIAQKIRTLGIHKASLFPELASIAQKLKVDYGC
jgi:hypothetical protein